ncbi:unnamed protein product [Mytilus edulis]|uniref:Uncharacterized protein n=1 Tax=Mytilus edulis TaxID=6550 RepID=A0A8S3R6H5_MYTED|nr:unnamed protein product [Mytilus edulis]
MESGRNRQYNRQAFKTNKEKTLRKPTTLQDLSGSVTQKWIQAVTGSTTVTDSTTVGSLRRIKKTSFTKTNYTARVIRVSDSEMSQEKKSTLQLQQAGFKTNKENILKKNTTMQELSGSVTQKWSQVVIDSTTCRLLRRIKKKIYENQLHCKSYPGQ